MTLYYVLHNKLDLNQMNILRAFKIQYTNTKGIKQYKHHDQVNKC